MVEDVDRSRTDKVSKAPWLKIFLGFKLAMDPKKLLLAAAGIFIAYLGWWSISWVFYNTRSIPKGDDYLGFKEQTEKDSFLAEASAWTLLHRMAGSPVDKEIIDGWEKALASDPSNHKIKLILAEIKSKHYGLLQACPWTEDRGPNQFLAMSKLIQRDDQHLDFSGYFRFAVEPLYKFLLPVTYFFDSRAGGLLSRNRIYLAFIIFWTIAVWGIFGGAISRMAAVQLARNEKVGLRESVEFVLARWQGYVLAPVLPLAALLGLGIALCIFGFFFGITFALGDIIGGLLWPVTLIMGLIMAVIMVGLLGWPLMNATISTEGSDSFDALSRSYSYVYQVPWHCLGYAAVGIVYGAVLVFFVGFMGTLMVYLSNWGVEQGHIFESRDPSLLYEYAPTSFGWRDVLLKDSPYAVEEGGHWKIDQEKVNKLEWYKYTGIGTWLVALWLGILFLFVIGFSYSFFWTTATTIYLLLRQKVDDTDLDEVYLEEEEEKFMPPEAPAAPASTAPPGVKFNIVDAPAPAGPPPASPGPAAAPTPDGAAQPPALAPAPPAAVAPPANPETGPTQPPPAP